MNCWKLSFINSSLYKTRWSVSSMSYFAFSKSEPESLTLYSSLLWNTNLIVVSENLMFLSSDHGITVGVLLLLLKLLSIKCDGVIIKFSLFFIWNALRARRFSRFAAYFAISKNFVELALCGFSDIFFNWWKQFDAYQEFNTVLKTQKNNLKRFERCLTYTSILISLNHLLSKIICEFKDRPKKVIICVFHAQTCFCLRNEIITPKKKKSDLRYQILATYSNFLKMDTQIILKGFFEAKKEKFWLKRSNLLRSIFLNRVKMKIIILNWS